MTLTRVPLTPFTWRTCLLLCVPALLLAVWLRWQLLLSIPEAFYGADSNSYLETAYKLWEQQKFVFSEKRRGLYPLLLVLAPLLPGSTAQLVAVLQHLFGLLAIPAIGWITGSVTLRPVLWVPITTCFAALTPAALWYEHEIIADAPLYLAFVCALALAFPVSNLHGRRLAWFLGTAFLCVAIKPHGRPLWLGLILAAALLKWPIWRWPRVAHGILAASVVVIFFTGSSSQGSWLLLSSTLPLVQIEGEKFAEYRRLLAPVIRDARADLLAYPERQGKFKKALSTKDPDGLLGPEWPPLVRDKARYAAATSYLAREAIRTHPWEYLRLTIIKIAICSSDSPAGVFRFHPADFWQAQNQRNDDRWKEPAEMKLIYERDQAAYEAMAAERISRARRVPAWPVAIGKALTWVRIDPRRAVPGLSNVTWVAWLGLLGVAALGWRRQWAAAAFLLLPLGIYLAGIYAIGDAVSRYFMPIEWMGILLACLGLDGLLGAVWRARSPGIDPEVVEQKL